MTLPGDPPAPADAVLAALGAVAPMTISPVVLLRQMVEKIEDFAILTVDPDANITSWNAGARKIFGYDTAEALGRGSGALFTDEDIANGEPFVEMQKALEQGRAGDYRWHRRKDGSLFWGDGVQTPIFDDHDGSLTGFLKIVRDITERKQAQDEVNRLATIDSLTGLYNRASFDARRIELAAAASRSGQKLLLFMIDLDRFKEVNDTYGHLAGDQLLAEAAARVRAISRGSDIVARIGGDEFALLQLAPSSPLHGAIIASKILAALGTPFKFGNIDMSISASIGIAVFPDDAGTPDGLLKSADLALYQAKSAGRNGYHYFTTSLDEVAHRRHLDQSELKRIERAEQFWLVYQPIFEANSNRLLKFEALLRFPGPVMSTNSVDYVIELAKEIGLITRIGLWVFGEVCKQLCQWRSMGWTGFRIAVNTCAKELLQQDYLPGVLQVLHRNGLRPRDIVLELTERDAIEMGQQSATIVQELADLGFDIVLDDFGTGYSALSYLRTLPVTGIKLDKSFLQGVPDDADANAVTRAVITLARDLRLQVIAEGVEHDAQLVFLRDAGCEAFQGFLLAEPMTAEQATQWLLDSRQAPAPPPP